MYSNRKPRRLLPPLLAGAFFFVLALGWFVDKTFAETTRFFPKTCLGEWIGSKNAQDQPELNNDFKPDDLNENNSALFPGGNEKIYCGNFEGQIPQDAEIKDVTLKIVWGFKQKQEIINSSGEGEVVDQVSEVVGEEPLTEQPAAEESTEQNSSQEPVAEEPPAEAPAEEVPAAEQPAAEESVQESPSEEPAAPLEEERSQEERAPAEAPAEEVPAAEQPAAEETAEAQAFWHDLIFKKAHASESELFELRYTLDGDEWHSFGVVSKDNFQSEFSLTLDTISALNSAQIAIEPLNPDNDIIVFLEGMYFQINYAEVVEVDEPSVEAEDGSKAVSFPALRKFERDVEIDPTAKFSCSAEPFTLHLDQTQSEEIAFSVIDPDGGKFDIEVGTLPYGVDAKFSRSNDYRLNNLGDNEKTEIRLRSFLGGQSGSFNLPVVVTKNRFLNIGEESVILCGFNIVISEQQ
jgi:hypothetical protein